MGNAGVKQERGTVIFQSFITRVVMVMSLQKFAEVSVKKMGTGNRDSQKVEIGESEIRQSNDAFPALKSAPILSRVN